MQAKDTNQEQIESMCKLIFRAIARMSDEESQSVKFADLMKSLNSGEGLTAEKAAEVKKSIRGEEDLKRFIERLEA